MNTQQQQAAAAPVTISAGDNDTDSGGPGGSGSMPEEVFKWMTHAVNEDFVGMGYPAILTKSGEQEFVNLCPLIRNCSSVLTLVKARSRGAVTDGDRKSAGGASNGAIATTTAAVAAVAVTSRRKRRGWGLFSSSKQHRRAHHQQLQSQQQHQLKHQLKQQQQQQQQLQPQTRDSLHESMARKMRKDTERIIRRTACLNTGASAEAAGFGCPQSPYPEGSQEHQDFVFMHSTWRRFRKLAQAQIVECAEAVKRSEELQREVATLTGQLERLRAAAHSEDATNLTSSCVGGGGAGGRLQRVGGFLRRAVSKERLTFGRRATKACDEETATASSEAGVGGAASKRSRSCSLPGITPSSQAPKAPFDLQAEMRRLRMEFDRRERLLLTEREKLRQLNSKLNFRVQHLSGLAAAAKQNGSNSAGGGSAGGGGGCGKDADLQHRRLERRAAALQREVTTLKQELNEKIDCLTGIGAAVANFSYAVAAADGATGTESAQPPGADLPTDAGRVPQLLDSVCQAALARLRRLKQSQLAAQDRAAALGDCLQLVQRKLGLTRGAVENARAMEVELQPIAARLASVATLTAASRSGGGGGGGGGISRSLSVSGRRFHSDVERRPQEDGRSGGGDGDGGGGASGGGQQNLELRDRIIGQLTAMLRERQEEVRRLKETGLSCQDRHTATAAAADGCGHFERDQPGSQANDSRSNAFP